MTHGRSLNLAVLRGRVQSSGLDLTWSSLFQLATVTGLAALDQSKRTQEVLVASRSLGLPHTLPSKSAIQSRSPKTTVSLSSVRT